MKEEVIKSYKGFGKDMKCRGFQYEEGKTYEMDGGVAICESGFHACERPLDVFGYYAPGESVYHEVEQSGEFSRQPGSDDTKVASSKIKIGARLDIAGIVKAHIEYVKAHTTMEHTDPKMATAGESGAATAGESGAATAGESGAATAGDKGAATAGDKGAATAGNYGAATAGKYGAATAGDKGAATAGNYGAATAGKYGAATSRGKSAVGENGVALARGDNVRVKGGIGAVLVIVEENILDYHIKDWKAFVIDGKTFKPDTWYELVDGEIKEAESESL